MNRKKIVIANWKMNMSVPESTVLLEKYLKGINPSGTDVVACPSFLDIYSAEKVLIGSKIKVGAQNVFYEDAGAYTGEVSPNQIKGFAEYCIIGHSERRNHFGETDKIVAKKASALVRHGITPIICVGENLHEKMDGLTKLVVAGQVEASLAELTGKEIAGSIVAYEPVWAIGTGHVCEPKKAAEVIRNIRNLIKVMHGEAVSESVRVIYGGSIDDKTVKGFLSGKDNDGFLVGGASLDHEKFAAIIMAVDGGEAPKVKVTSRPRVVKKQSKARKKKK